MMRALLITLMLSLPLVAQAAKWDKVGSIGGADSYIDKTSIMKNDKGTRAWSLVSYGKEQTTPDGTPYLSMKALHLYSCKERTTTLQMQVFYTEAMGKGEQSRAYKYEKFDPEDVIPDSVADGALQLICRGKK
jgi:hypothetical protein